MEAYISKIDELKEVIRKMPNDLLHERVYICFSNSCILLTSFLDEKGKPGWSRRLINSAKQPILSLKEQETIEKTFAQAPWILQMLKGNAKTVQKGGGPPELSESSSGIVETIIDEGSKITGDDVSMDGMFQKFLDKSGEMDSFWNKFAYETPGISKMMNIDISVPVGPVPVPVPVKPVMYFLFMILDAFRLSRALMGNKDVPLTLLVFIEELVTGQWRQMLLTLVGLISPSGVAIGILGKYIVAVWLLINPEMRSTIVSDVYKGSKSVFIGFVLWCGTVLPPNVLKLPLQEAVSKLQGMVDGFDEKIGELEKQGSEALKPVGKILKFRGVDLSTMKKISLEDIQNLQALAQWDLLICSKEYQDIQAVFEKDPIFRLLLELLNVPTTDEDKYQICHGEFPAVADKIKDAMKPSIEDDPNNPVQLPTIPEIPPMPQVPELPKVPEMPPMPQVPELPKVPEMPPMPQVPEMPPMPQVPEMPSTSELSKKVEGGVKSQASSTLEAGKEKLIQRGGGRSSRKKRRVSLSKEFEKLLK